MDMEVREMTRTRRKIESRKCYEVCFRARRGLPLVAYKLIALIIGSVVARVQRDQKVDICHDIWNGSHAHLFLLSRDAEMFTRFLGEVQKQITDIIKRLLGYEHLNIWEGRPMIAEILDLDMAIDRISYLYANPAQDNLVDSIENFPGFSSWSDYKLVENDTNAQSFQTYPWLRLPTIPLLESRVLTKNQDESLVTLLRHVNQKSHLLIRQPNLWMRCFGVTSKQEVESINLKIENVLRIREEEARLKRLLMRKSVIGVAALTSQPIMKFHKPKKYERKIYCLSSINELRISFIQDFKEFCRKCQECYKKWRAGDYTVEWPPGAFRPPMRPSYNILSDTYYANFASS